MDIQEAIKKRSELENDIMKLVVNFTSETGMTPNNIRIYLNSMEEIGQAKPIPIVEKVEVDVFL